MDMDAIPAKDTGKKSVATAKPEMVTVCNRLNAPYDLTLTSLSLMWRLEPRGKEGDTIQITAAQADCVDFQSALPYIIVSK